MRYVTGAYLTFTYEMGSADVPEGSFDLHKLRDENGNELPGGMNLSARMTFTCGVEEMIGVDKLPDTITLTDDLLPGSISGDAPVVRVVE